ncbi:MAG: hypothetical protein AB7L09_02915 [Nitrospira sp.]
MTSRDFCYWLQGLFELANPPTLDEKKTRLIKQHLNLVFIHEIDPSHSDDPKVQGALQAVHDGIDVNELRTKLEELRTEFGDLEQLDPSSLEKTMTSIKRARTSGPSGLEGGPRDMRLMC